VRARGASSSPASEIVSSSSLLDWVDLKQLHALTGQPESRFDEVIVKELIDNAIDAAERAGVAPVVGVRIYAEDDHDVLVVSDNGPGLTAEALATISDFRARASSKDWRRAPSRGQQGNAFKTVLGIPVAYQRDRAPHERRFLAAEVAGPHGAWDIYVNVNAAIGTVRAEVVEKTGPDAPGLDKPTNDADPGFSRIKIALPKIDRDVVAELAYAYAAANPHLTLTLDVDDDDPNVYEATAPTWRPNTKTSIAWYTAADFARYCDAARQLGWNVGRVVASFAGCSAKDVIASVVTGIAPVRMPMVDLDGKAQERLYNALREHGAVLGADDLRPAGKESLLPGGRYAREAGEWIVDGAAIPFVVEAALLADDDARGDVITAINYSPTFSSPWPDAVFRRDDEERGWPFAGHGLGGYLAAFNVDESAPVRVVVHVVCPRLDYRDRGKSAIDTRPELADAVAEAIHRVARKFFRDEEKHRRVQERLRRHEVRKIKAPSKDPDLTEVMAEVIPTAYAQAAGAFTFAMGRQIFYKARPLFQQYTAKELTSSYFLQNLLPRFVDENPDLTDDWQIFHDARGHLWEPHGGKMVPLGTGEVRAYLARERKRAATDAPPYRFETSGPGNRYSTILFVEKEGFTALLEESGLLDEFDVCLMSTKGMSTEAARRLLEELQDEVTIMALHDFDIDGTSIASTLARSTPRVKLVRPPKVIDIGMRLDDVLAHGLPSESVILKKDRRKTLERNGATDDEIEFLLSGQRVELNAFGNDEFVAWVRSKLEVHARKVIPDASVLARAFDEAQRHQLRVERMAELEREIEAAKVDAAPSDLIARVRAVLVEQPRLSWDEAIAIVASKENE
jgi:hypothetical protein